MVVRMTRQLNITGKNSSEIYTLLYPNNLINFCKYDFTLFLNHCTDLCRLANRTGEFNMEDVYSIRNSISGCHKYYEQNMRTTFEKIVIDCWIEYLCRQSEIGTGTLWQSFMRCKNDFEKAVFSRLSEYRHNRAINEWVNLLKLQEYAQRKVDFVFGVELNSAAEAGCRANYFDLMFNVAANEQGFPVEEMGASSLYSIGRVPNSPFVLSNASKEIVRNVLDKMDYPEKPYKAKSNPQLSDQTAMDAFSVIKTYIPDKNDSLVNTIIKSMSGTPQHVYIPASFKAVIDLEIDAIIESGGFLHKCPRCGEYYLRDEEYPYEYCNRPQKDGSVCIDVMNSGKETPVKLPIADEPDFVVVEPKNEPLDKAYVNEKLEALYKEMAARVNIDMTQRDFSIWYQADLRLKEKLLTGAAGESDLEDFIELSRGDEFASKKRMPPPPPTPEPKEEPIEITESGKEVRKFVFERVERPAPPKQQSLAESEKAALEAVRRLFAANANQRQQPQAYYPQAVPQYAQPKPTTKVIRGGAVNTGYKENAFDAVKPKSVVIPNGEAEKKAVPFESRPLYNEPRVRRPEPEDEDVKVFRTKREIEEDVKVFVPKKPAFNAYIEPSPYEKIKEPLEKYKREQEEKEAEEEVQIEGQISADEVEAVAQKEEIPPVPQAAPAVSAKAFSAYRNISTPRTEPQTENKPERADFAGILEGMNRNDGFMSEEEELDADGMPVSHKTKHVMNALFGNAKASPFLRVNLDDDEE
ncbi:MAG: hypothetical protein IJ416_03990 [Ruminiclostridium sp.]|nr:hypothetical protein [Ruminiclostridium sp.]